MLCASQKALANPSDLTPTLQTCEYLAHLEGLLYDAEGRKGLCSAHLRNRGPFVSGRPGAASLVAGAGLLVVFEAPIAGIWGCIAAAREAVLNGKLPRSSKGRLNTSHFSNAAPAQQRHPLSPCHLSCELVQGSPAVTRDEI